MSSRRPKFLNLRVALRLKSQVSPWAPAQNEVVDPSRRSPPRFWKGLVMNGNDIFSNLQQESKKVENRKGNLHYFDGDLLFYLFRNDYCVCVLMLDIS